MYVFEKINESLYGMQNKANCKVRNNKDLRGIDLQG